VVGVSPSIVPFIYSKRTAVTRSLVSLIEKRTFCGRFKCTPAVELPMHIVHVYTYHVVILNGCWLVLCFYKRLTKPRATSAFSYLYYYPLSRKLPPPRRFAEGRAPPGPRTRHQSTRVEVV
jgi:hypothetical protein